MSLKNSIKSTAFALLLTTASLQSAIVDALSATVNNEPITLYDIHRLANAQNITLDNALETLIQEALVKSQIKALGITADSFEVRNRMEDVARQNNLTYLELLTYIRGQNIQISDYENEIATVIKQEKLYQMIFANAGSGIEMDDIVSYYQANHEAFIEADSIHVIIYESPFPDQLDRAIMSPMRVFENVRVYDFVYGDHNVDDELKFYLNQTQEGEFTPILQRENKHYRHKVVKKVGTRKKPLEEVQGQIENELMQKHRMESINNYFEKLRARANISILRQP